MTALVAEEWDDFSVVEWNRLDRIASKYDGQLKTAYLQTVVQGNQANSLIVHNVITDCVIETAIGTANTYGIVFNPNSPRYRTLIDGLTDKYMGVVSNDEAKGKVKAILPSGISLADRNDRLNVFGLSARDAVRLERMRQKGISRESLDVARLNMRVQRGNLIALTEVNRIVNATLEEVWLDNQTVAKARRPKYSGKWYVESDGRVKTVRSLRGIPAHATKEVVTRRDGRVCDYCTPLDRVRAKIGTDFETQYGFFSYPPFHPRCRCYMIVRF